MNRQFAEDAKEEAAIFQSSPAIWRLRDLAVRPFWIDASNRQPAQAEPRKSDAPRGRRIAAEDKLA